MFHGKPSKAKAAEFDLGVGRQATRWQPPRGLSHPVAPKFIN